MASIVVKRPTNPGSGPVIPKKPTTKAVTESRKEYASKSVSSKTSNNKLKLLDVLKGVPEDISLDDIYLELSTRCVSYPSDKTEGTIALVSVSSKKNPKYASTMKRYAAALKKYEEDKAVWDAKCKQYKKDMKAYDKYRREQQLKAERKALLKRMEQLDQELDTKKAGMK